mgnify:CR=1 FL=1
MYAIIRAGSKQYKVKKGDVIAIEKTDQSEGEFTFSEVLAFFDGTSYQVGLPHVGKVQVVGEILGEVKGPKTIAFKYRRRKDSKSTKGHRQTYHEVKIVEILAA